MHYDLRLQFSETSTVSFAVPYGLPGNPNSIRPNRMAIETRVHNLWVGCDYNRLCSKFLLAIFHASWISCCYLPNILTSVEQPHRVRLALHRIASHLGYWRIRDLTLSRFSKRADHRGRAVGLRAIYNQFTDGQRKIGRRFPGSTPTPPAARKQAAAQLHDRPQTAIRK